jgi:hypothetical protein
MAHVAREWLGLRRFAQCGGKALRAPIRGQI